MEPSQFIPEEKHRTTTSSNGSKNGKPSLAMIPLSNSNGRSVCARCECLAISGRNLGIDE